MCARMVGRILEDIATEKCLPVIRGVAAKEHALHWELISLASVIRKKMSMSKVFTVENTLGWVSVISILRENSYGAMGHLSTSITGQNTNQTTLVTRIVFILLVFCQTISTNGTM